MINFEKPNAKELFSLVLQNLIKFCKQSSLTGLQHVFEELNKDLHKCKEFDLNSLLGNEEKLKQIKESQLQETILKKIFLKSFPKPQQTFKETESAIYKLFDEEYESISKMISSQSQKLQICLLDLTLHQKDIPKPNMTIPYDASYYMNCKTEKAKCEKLIKCFQSLNDMVQLIDLDISSSFDSSLDSTECLKNTASIEEQFLETFYLKILELHLALYDLENRLVTPRDLTAQKPMKTLKPSTHSNILAKFEESDDSEFSSSLEALSNDLKECKLASNMSSSCAKDDLIIDSPTLTPTFDIKLSNANMPTKDNSTKETHKDEALFKASF